MPEEQSYPHPRLESVEYRGAQATKGIACVVERAFHVPRPPVQRSHCYESFISRIEENNVVLRVCNNIDRVSWLTCAMQRLRSYQAIQVSSTLMTSESLALRRKEAYPYRDGIKLDNLLPVTGHQAGA